MDNFQSKPDIWEQNPKLKTLLLILIFVFLFSGISLVIFAQWSNNYREQVYEQTQAGLPKHQISQSANQQISSQPVDTSTWKTYKDDEYGFEIKYPSIWSVSNASNVVHISEKPNYDGLYILPSTQQDFQRCSVKDFAGKKAYDCTELGFYSLIYVKNTAGTLLEVQDTLGSAITQQILETFKFTK